LHERDGLQNYQINEGIGHVFVKFRCNVFIKCVGLCVNVNTYFADESRLFDVQVCLDKALESFSNINRVLKHLPSHKPSFQ